MSTTLKWSLLIAGALIIAAIPTRVSSHDVAVGIPFTWHTRQEVVTLGAQPHSFSAGFLLADFGISLLVLSVVASRFVRGLHDSYTKGHKSLLISSVVLVTTGLVAPGQPRMDQNLVAAARKAIAADVSTNEITKA